MQIIIRGPAKSGKSMLGNLIFTVLDVIGVPVAFEEEDRKLRGVGNLLRGMRKGKPPITIRVELL